MKRLFIMLTLVGSSLFMSSYAADVKATPVVVQAFQHTFYGAEEVAWQQAGIFYKATFVLEGEYHAAFYNADGELVAETQNIASSKLPRALQASLKQELQGRWIADGFVVTVEGDETYYVTLENADTTVVLKSAGAKKWTIYKRIDK